MALREEYLKTLQWRDAQQDKDNYADKGRDTLLDGYTEEEFERICRELWTRGGASPEYHLRTLVDLLLGHYMLARGGCRRAPSFRTYSRSNSPAKVLPVVCR